MELDFRSDVENVGRIDAVPTILEVICRSTGMRFAAVARVTGARWVACSVLDEIAFGLAPGGELDIKSTICHEIEQGRKPVIIDHVAEDEVWCNHPAPAMFGFQSYISMPIILEDGFFFGTLCAIDPLPARLKTPETIGMFRLFTQLIAKNLDTIRKQSTIEAALISERANSELREQFIAVLGHDLRTPVRSIKCLTQLLMRTALDERGANLARIVVESASRMQLLIDNLLDLARGRLGGGLTLCGDNQPLEPLLRASVDECSAGQPDRVVEIVFALAEPVFCDRSRIAQLFSNLLGNALAYGSADQPISIRAISDAQTFELSVANSGDPIPQVAMDHLFQPFYRSEVLKNRDGLGLGLYIAHEIATAHGGTLQVESNETETRFTLRMPVVFPF